MAEIICDCGGTKATWILFNRGKVTKIVTEGHNFARQPLDDFIIPDIKEPIQKLTLYGAGILTTNDREIIDYLTRFFPRAEIECGSDLLGASRALCFGEPGMIVILGTGSNSCLFDGHQILNHVPSLGYIMGDEGSGAALGKEFIKRYLRGKFNFKLPGITEREVIDRVYRQGEGAAYFSSFAPTILKLAKTDYDVELMIEDCFERLVDAYLDDFLKDIPVHFGGSIAWHFRDYLSAVLRDHGFKIDQIVANPIDLFVERYQNGYPIAK